MATDRLDVVPAGGEEYAMARVLIIEDEAPIRRGLCDLLAWHGHSPHGVADGTTGLAEALSGTWDLCVVDVMLPGVDGLTICRQVRDAKPSQALLLLTARGREEDVLDGFRAGCDDYVTKPFSIAQLVARVEALVRRAASASTSVVRIGDLELDADNLRVRAGSEERALTRRDVEVLAYLWRERHRVVSRTDLLRAVWGYERPDHVETRAVDMHVVKLRRKLEGLVPVDFLETVRGAGYRLKVAS
jgi:DNA-binding response OmpR family regulator